MFVSSTDKRSYDEFLFPSPSHSDLDRFQAFESFVTRALSLIESTIDAIDTASASCAPNAIVHIQLL